MNKTQLKYFLIAILGFALAFGLFDQAAAFEVSQVCWCEKVSDRLPVQDTILDSTRPQSWNRISQLNLWTRLSGTSSDISLMETEHKLPLKHIWRYEQSGTLYSPNNPKFDQSEDFPTNLTPTDSPRNPILHAIINLDFGSPSTFYVLKQYMETSKVFFWRTWSNVNVLCPARWEVTVEYADGSQVFYRNKPAVFQIVLK